MYPHQRLPYIQRHQNNPNARLQQALGISFNLFYCRQDLYSTILCHLDSQRCTHAKLYSSLQSFLCIRRACQEQLRVQYTAAAQQHLTVVPCSGVNAAALSPLQCTGVLGLPSCKWDEQLCFPYAELKQTNKFNTAIPTHCLKQWSKSYESISLPLLCCKCIMPGKVICLVWVHIFERGQQVFCSFFFPFPPYKSFQALCMFGIFPWCPPVCLTHFPGVPSSLCC